MSKQWVVVGNWKMYLTLEQSVFLAKQYKRLAKQSDVALIAAPSDLALPAVQKVLHRSAVSLAAQTISWEEHGALTGENAPDMVVDTGCQYAIIGHSERKQYFGETVETMARRAYAAVEHGITPIICLGENYQQRQTGQADTVLSQQVEQIMDVLITSRQRHDLIFCYEPFWTISTSGGRIATSTEVAHSLAVIKQQLLEYHNARRPWPSIRLLYGGSVTAETVRQFMDIADLEGFLVGSAATRTDDLTALLTTLSA